MARRVAVTRAPINKPAALPLDEPMGALDSFTRADIQDKLLELRRENDATMILATHDVDEAIYLSDRIFEEREPGIGRQCSGKSRGYVKERLIYC
jgi:NitT/TauT family transport system ATP-binding protein/sulfonate transport system ATP-binding protein